MISEDEKQNIVNMLYDVVPIDEATIECMPFYGIYNRSEGKYYCTACNVWRDFSKKKGKLHREKMYCPYCSNEITMLSERLSRGNISAKTNFVRFLRISETQLVAAFFTVELYFSEPKTDYYNPVEHGTVDYKVALLGGYYYEPGRAVKLLMKPLSTWGYPRSVWEWTWVESNPNREPCFSFGIFNHNYDDYYMIDTNEIYETCFKYAWTTITGCFSNLHMAYLTLFVEHPNAEYLCKADYIRIVHDRVSGYGMYGLRINWKSNDLKKMLGLNSEEIIKLGGSDALRVANYKKLKKLQNGECDMILKAMDLGTGNVLNVLSKAKVSYRKILEYTKGQSQICRDWADYLRECDELDYDLTDTAIQRPKNLYAAHARTSRLVVDIRNAESDAKIRENLKEYTEKLCYENEELQIVIPKRMSDIVVEGKVLNHCVGGYAERHAKGVLYIVFLRKKSEPEKPFYTIEVNLKGEIVQCRGYKNNHADNPKTEDIIQFEEEYQKFLDDKFKNKRKKESA